MKQNLADSPLVFTAVNSTTLSHAAYDTSRQRLWLDFHNDARYCYFDVPPQIHQDLMNASSKGKYFNLRIRPYFSCKKQI
jgi:hypothetical protein